MILSPGWEATNSACCWSVRSTPTSALRIVDRVANTPCRDCAAGGEAAVTPSQVARRRSAAVLAMSPACRRRTRRYDASSALCRRRRGAAARRNRRAAIARHRPGSAADAQSATRQRVLNSQIIDASRPQLSQRIKDQEREEQRPIDHARSLRHLQIDRQGKGRGKRTGEARPSTHDAAGVPGRNVSAKNASASGSANSTTIIK